VRLAIGAGRGRIARQLLAESLLLSILGGAIGLGIAVAAARIIALRTLATPEGPIGIELAFDWRVVLFATVMTMLTTALFGLMPALQSTRAAVHPALKDGSATGGTTRSRLRTTLVTAQVALSALLLVMAALLGRSLLAAMSTDRGFDADHVLTATVDLAVRGYTPQRGTELYEQLLGRIEQTPGIQAATLVDIVPLTLSNQAGVLLKEGQELPTDGRGSGQINVNAVSRGHFRTLNIALLLGRDFAEGDRADAEPVAIVNETLARRFWPGESPIGKRVRFVRSRTSFGPWLDVVGVVRDSKYVSVGEDPRAFVYRPIAQAYVSKVTLLAKTTGEPTTMVPAVRAHVRALDPDLPLSNVGPLESATNLSLVPVQIAAMLAGIVGLTALALAAIGIYGVTSYLVRQRTREIGIRLALGAQPREIVRLVTREGMRWTIVGLAIGLTMALAAAQLLSGLLYGITPADPVAFIGVAVLLAVTSYVACLNPAERTSRTDPMIALRSE
jgi:predicted permease